MKQNVHADATIAAAAGSVIHRTRAILPGWCLALAILVPAWSTNAQQLQYRSPFLAVELAADQPNFTAFSVDSLGKGKLDVNAMLPLAPSSSYAVTRNADTIEYRVPEAVGAPAWSFTFNQRGMVIHSSYSAKNAPQPLVLSFDPIVTHATLLGLLNDQGQMRLPALLHFPDHGTLRITTATPRLALGYDALRGDQHDQNFVRVTFPAADKHQPELEYRLEVTAIYPSSPTIENDPRYDGYRRDFLNILQINPRRRVLANNAASDVAAFTMFEYSMMAVRMPPLADGLSANDILRQSLDRYIGGMKGYGIKFYDEDPTLFDETSDTYPSLVMATADYVRASGDKEWLKRNYSVIQTWADKMIEFDRDGDGLMESPVSGNSGTWTGNWAVESFTDDWKNMQCCVQHPSNWWDTVGFGHKDAYANALAYKAFNDMAELASLAGHEDGARLYRHRAEMLKAAYFKTFYNPATGVLAGWQSADGKLHDYYFLFVSGVAVTYGVVTPEQGNQIWDKLLAKMKEVGYDHFEYGLPGNLIPIRREDYTVRARGAGGSDKDDGSGGFQNYENGGATACYAYFTIQALRTLGRDKEADAILYPMLKSFESGGFQGRGPDGNSYDWKRWDGSPGGYEGLLVDGYLTLLAAAPPEARK